MGRESIPKSALKAQAFPGIEEKIASECIGAGPMKENFVPRSPRFSLRLPVRFFTSEGLYVGHSINISDSGVSIRFERSIDVWISGELSFLLEDRHPSIEARVARVEGREAGLSFKIRSDLDRSVIRDMVLIAQAQTPL